MLEDEIAEDIIIGQDSILGLTVGRRDSGVEEDA